MKKQLENKYSFSGGPMYKVKVDTSGWAVQEKQIKKLKKTLHKEVTTELIELWNALNEHIAETQELITLLDNRQAALEKRVTTLERPIPSMCGGSDDGKGAWGAGGGCASEPKQECQCKGRKLVYSINGGSEKCRKCDLPLPTNTKEEVKGCYWMINTRGTIVISPKSGKKYPERKEFGDVFKTKKKAEIALKRVKALFRRINK